jgi:hypothetical protein
MEKNNQVVFRRIHGRIVPIKVKKSDFKDKNLREAGALAATGTISAVGAGLGAAKIVEKAAHMRKVAERNFSIANSVLQNAKKTGQLSLDFVGNADLARVQKNAAVAQRAASFAVRKLRKPILSAGIVGTGFLAEEAAISFYKSKFAKRHGIAHDPSRLERFGFQGLGHLAGLATLGVYYKKLGAGSFKNAFKYAKAAWSGTSELLPKLPIRTPLGALRL